jgi:hypothetical protein
MVTPCPGPDRMNTTVLTRNETVPVRAAAVEGEALWLTPEELARATEWEWTPDGLCRGALCVPVPPAAPWVREDGAGMRVDLVGLARHLGQPVAASPAHGVWAIGESHAALGDRLRSLDAPDFTLPDLAGRAWSLREFRGRKVFLLAWASW